MHKVCFNVAMYLRLSKDDEDRDGISKSESNSIGSQRDLIRLYIKEHDELLLYDVYVDDGYSGSNFDRPEFKRMLSDIEAGNVDCIIVKDLSRFGRDYIEVGRYLQKIFPERNVRFIALTDHYDSLSADSGEVSIILPVKNFINDSYCRDISTKVKSQFDIKRKNGEYIAAFAVYGYKKAENDKNSLVIDEYAADIVRKIFAWRIEGMSNYAIAEKLNSLGILSPREYKQSLGFKFYGGRIGPGPSKWRGHMVKHILTNEVYLGHMVQGRTEQVNYKIKKSIQKPQSEWIRVENTHQAIISEEDFLIVQNLLRSDVRRNNSNEPNFFCGLIFCGDCKEPMVRRIIHYKNESKVYYICSTYNRGEGCTRRAISEDDLKDIVFSTIRHYVNLFMDQKKLFDAVKDIDMNYEIINYYDKELTRMKEERKHYFVLIDNLMDDLKEGVVSKTEYSNLRISFQEKIEQLDESIEKQNKLVHDMLKTGILSAKRLELFKHTLELREIDRYTLCSLVKRISIYEDRKIEIEFNFQDEFEIMMKVNQRETV